MCVCASASIKNRKLKHAIAEGMTKDNPLSDVITCSPFATRTLKGIVCTLETKSDFELHISPAFKANAAGVHLLFSI